MLHSISGFKQEIEYNPLTLCIDAEISITQYMFVKYYLRFFVLYRVIYKQMLARFIILHSYFVFLNDIMNLNDIIYLL